MIRLRLRLRLCLLLLAVTALLVTGTPLSAGTADPGLPSGIAPPTAGSWLDADRCANPDASAAVAPVAPLERVIVPPDFILCTCKLCQRSPDVICQISPSGYSIRCADWAQTHC